MQKVTGFKIILPSWLPAGAEFAGALGGGRSNDELYSGIILFYRIGDKEVRIDQTDLEFGRGIVVTPEESINEKVRGKPASYTPGRVKETGDAYHNVAWVDGRMAFEVAGTIPKGDILRIAESLIQ